jgi:hypothetical protein
MHFYRSGVKFVTTSLRTDIQHTYITPQKKGPSSGGCSFTTGIAGTSSRSRVGRSNEGSVVACREFERQVGGNQRCRGRSGSGQARKTTIFPSPYSFLPFFSIAPILFLWFFFYLNIFILFLPVVRSFSWTPQGVICVPCRGSCRQHH